MNVERRDHVSGVAAVIRRDCHRPVADSGDVQVRYRYSACGVKDGPKPLAVRMWACAACGTAHDRDLNAAKNILAAGRAERLNACGTSARPRLTGAAGVEAGTHRSAAGAALREFPPPRAG